MELQALLLYLAISILQVITKIDVISPDQILAWTNPDYARVARVVDGDTVVLGTEERVRYIGIDTPELNTNNDKTIDCFAEEAKTKNQNLVEGKIVRLEKDVSDKDRYGRLLRYVYLDNVFINEELLKEGYATAATFPPDVRYSEYFLEVQDSAMKNEKGLWGKCDGG